MATLAGIPVITTASVPQGPNGPLIPEIDANAPHAQYVARKGLLIGKKAYVFATRGGRYAGTAFDTQTDFVRNLLGFIGITEVEFVYAEDLNMGEESKNAGQVGTHAELARIAA